MLAVLSQPVSPCNLGNCREIWPSCRDNAFTSQQKTPCISVAWLGFSLIRGAGRPKFLAGKVESKSPCQFSSRSTLGSLTDTRSRTGDVCFAPKSGHAQRPNQCPLSAIRGHSMLHARRGFGLDGVSANECRTDPLGNRKEGPDDHWPAQAFEQGSVLGPVFLRCVGRAWAHSVPRPPR